MMAPRSGGSCSYIDEVIAVVVIIVIRAIHLNPLILPAGC